MAIGVVAMGTAAAKPSAPEPVFRWIAQPTIRVCKDAKVPLDRVRRAMEWWEDHGARFAGIEEATCGFRDDGTPLRRDEAGGVAFNTITIHRVGGLAALKRAGDTRWAVYGEVPLWAVVALPPGGEEGLTLEHELGHALGFPHVSTHGHIMNPRLELVGEKVDGLVTTDESG